MEGNFFTKNTKLYMILQNLKHFSALKMTLEMVWSRWIWVIKG